MSNAKRFLSVILAMIMVLSTLVIGASAYSDYKGDAIKGQYNKLDKPVLTTEQYASAAVDELDRMLGKEQIKLDKSDLYGIGSLDLTSVDATMKSVYDFVTGRTFETFKGMLGDLGNLSANAFKDVTRAGSGDIGVLYAVLQFLYDNKGIFVSYVDQTINLGSILPSVVDLSDYTDVNMLLKTMLYKEVYTTVDASGNKVRPDTESASAKATIKATSIDTMVQKLIDDLVIKEIPELSGYTNISSGSMYSFIDNALKQAFNSSLVLDALNGSVKDEIKKACGVEFQKNADGSYVKDSKGNKVEANRDNLNGYANYLNIDYTYSGFTFGSGSFVSQINNILGSFVDVLLKDKTLVTWQTGDNSKLMNNLVALAKAVLVKTGDDFFAPYIKVADEATINKMTNEELIVYALRAIINGSVKGLYIPDDVTTVIDFAYYGMTQLLATSAPELDFSNYAKNLDTIIIMGVDYAIYSVNSAIDMGLSYAYSMSDVDAQLKIAAKYGIDNYGGLLNGLSLSTSDSGWTTLNKIVDGVLGLNWLPTSSNRDVKTFVIDDLIGKIANLDLKGVLDLFELSAYPSASDLNKTPKAAVLDIVTRVVNIIFPGALNASATTIDALATNAALAKTVDAIFSDLYNYRANLVKGALPIVCSILSLTTAQEFKFPTVTCDTLIYDKSGAPSFTIKFRNNSSGINTGYTDANGVFHQDQLYTYKIESVTSNLDDKLNIAYSKSDVAAGEEVDLSVSSKSTVSGTTPFIVTITYNVLTEDGSNLTASPMTEKVYSFISASAADDRDKELSVTASGYTFTGSASIYASSMRDIYRAQFTVQNAASDSPVTGTPIATATKPIDATYIKAKTDAFAITPKNGDQSGMGKTYALQTTEAYAALTDAERDTVWAAICASGTSSRVPGKYTYTFGANIGGTKVQKAGYNIFCYNDYGLESLLSSEIGKHRQQSNYSTGWSDWTAAMQQAVNVVYAPFVANSFLNQKAKQYKAAYTKLKAAVDTLDANEKAGGLSETKQIINSYAPSNEGKEFDAADYTYFGVADFEPYTYYNYRTEVRAAESMINRAEVPDATGKTYPADTLTVTYRNHRLSLYGERLLKKEATSVHLSRELTNAQAKGYVESNYTAESWAMYQRAVVFASAVLNEDIKTVRQSKVNTAYEMLLEYQKRLIEAGGTPGGDDKAVYDLISDVNVVETTDGKVLTGVTGGGAYDVAHYFSNLKNCTVELVENENGFFTTDAKILVKDNSGKVIDTYIVSVTGDVNGDGSDSDNIDTGIILAVAGLASKFDTQAQQYAADFTNDNVIDSVDVGSALSVVSLTAKIDYVNRTAVPV